MTATSPRPSQRRASQRAPRKPGRVVRVAREAASEFPVARVAVDVPLAHLDRPFDYLVAEADSATARPGVRVRVRFAGRLVDGFILERCADSGHSGRLAMVERVVSAEQVLAPEVAQVCRAVADRYAGTFADVVRVAVPPRHGRVEAESPRPAEEATEPAVSGSGESRSDEAGWARYMAGAAFLAAVAAGKPARAVWQALPGEDWPARLAGAAAAARGAGRGAILVVPDARDLARLERSLAALLPHHAYVALSADLGPAERYRRFLRVSRGQVQVVAGTRAAAFAPVRDLGLLAIFDDGDDLHSDPRSPYQHAREVLTMRSTIQHAALVIGGFARSAEGQLLVDSGWARPIVADRSVVRRAMPRIEAAGDDYAVGADSAAARARLSPAAFAAARAALDARAPVLVQVPRRGYLPGLACVDCGRPARCRRCSGPLTISAGGSSPSCGWCGVTAPVAACSACGSRRIRATVVGTRRTAEEIGRAFPGARLRTSTGGSVLESVPAEPSIVVATPGAEPVASGGYGAALLLDGGLLLSRPDLRAAEESLRRWMAAAALVRPAVDGGRVVVGADSPLPAVQALIRWDPVGHAEMELAARRELGFPPVVAMASLQGEEADLGRAMADLALPESAVVLGPTPVERRRGPGAHRMAGDGDQSRQPNWDEPGHDLMRALVRVPASDRKALAASLRTWTAARSARKDGASIRIQVDPQDLG